MDTNKKIKSYDSYINEEYVLLHDNVDDLINNLKLNIKKTKESYIVPLLKIIEDIDENTEKDKNFFIKIYKIYVITQNYEDKLQKDNNLIIRDAFRYIEKVSNSLSDDETQGTNDIIITREGENDEELLDKVDELYYVLDTLDYGIGQIHEYYEDSFGEIITNIRYNFIDEINKIKDI